MKVLIEYKKQKKNILNQKTIIKKRKNKHQNQNNNKNINTNNNLKDINNNPINCNHNNGNLKDLNNNILNQYTSTKVEAIKEYKFSKEEDINNFITNIIKGN